MRPVRPNLLKPAHSNLSLAATLILSASLTACIGNSGSDTSGDKAAPFAATADSDAFYTQAANMNQAPGTLLDSREVTFAPLGGIPMPNPAWQIRFISRDSNGQPIIAIATVVKPMTPAIGEAPLVAYQYAEDSLGSECAPSHSLTGSTNNSVSQSEAAGPLLGLLQGWTLVYPDHEGPQSAYGAGRLAGQITLDSIRAAQQFAPLGLNSKTPVGMWGYSGGAIATGWAATLHKAYAPELNIVAVASGGTPADVIGVARNVDTNPITNPLFFSLILSAIVGNNRAYPELITPVLNDKGRAALNSLRDGCNGNTSDGSSSPTGHLADYTTVSDPFDTPGVRRLAPLLSLPQAGQSPITDVFVYHSLLDELIPIAGADAMVDAWCNDGTHVAYYRGIAGEHVSFGVIGTPLAVAYLSSRLNGAGVTITPPGSVTCN